MLRSIDDPAVLEQLVLRFRALEPTTPRRWGTLSAHEMLCHVADANASVLGRPGGPAGASRPLRKWLALHTSLPWPHGLTTRPSVDPRQEGSRPTVFEQDRARAIEGLRALAVAPSDALPAAHGRFGAMQPRDWWRWGYRHSDHHLRQFGV